jgi:hypothetical protein
MRSILQKSIVTSALAVIFVAATGVNAQPTQNPQAHKKGAIQADASAARKKISLATEVSASRLPMLAERVTKHFAELQAGVRVSRARGNLAAAVGQFREDLKVVLATELPSDIRDNYELLQQLFVDFEATTKAAPSIAAVKKMAELNEEVAWIAHKGSGMIAAQLKSGQAKLIEDTGRARELIQRIAKLHFLKAAGATSKVISDDIRTAEAEYDKVIAQLKAASRNNNAVMQELALEEGQRIFLRDALARANKGNPSHEDLDVISKATDNILEAMGRVAARLEKA